MDSTSFDRLTRRLATPASRRTTLASVAAAVAGVLARRRTDAQPRTTCRELGQVCIPERNLDCCPGRTCLDGRCRCPEGKRRCQGRGVDVDRCCGGQCSGEAVCRDGRCECPRGRRRCGQRCVSRQQCCPGQKRCGQRCIPKAACCGGCPAGQTCQAGSCTCTAGSGPGCCDGIVCQSGTTLPHCKGPWLTCEACGTDELCGDATCGCVPDPSTCLGTDVVCGPTGGTSGSPP